MYQPNSLGLGQRVRVVIAQSDLWKPAALTALHGQVGVITSLGVNTLNGRGEATVKFSHPTQEVGSFKSVKEWTFDLGDLQER